MAKRNPFPYFKTSPEIIRLAVMLYVRFPLSLRNVEDLLPERGIDISHETVRFWWNRFGPIFASEIRRKRTGRVHAFSNWQWHLDEVFVKINGETHYLWRAVDHESEVLESYVAKRRDRKAALKFLRNAIRKYGGPEVIITDLLRSYGAARKNWARLIGSKRADGSTTVLRIRTCRSDEESRPCCGFGACEVRRNLSQYTALSEIISTRNDISTAEAISSRTDPLHWVNGANFVREQSVCSKRCRSSQFALTRPWQKMIGAEGEESDQIASALLGYCKLDTFAMVEIYRFLMKLAA